MFVFCSEGVQTLGQSLDSAKPCQVELQSGTEVSSALREMLAFRASSNLNYCIILYNKNLHGQPVKHKMADTKTAQSITDFLQPRRWLQSVQSVPNRSGSLELFWCCVPCSVTFKGHEVPLAHLGFPNEWPAPCIEGELWLCLVHKV